MSVPIRSENPSEEAGLSRKDQGSTRSRHRVLFLVTGLSPQIVTETLYALCVARKPPFIPDSIHLLTTREGAERARLMLFEEPQAHFFRFCEEFGLSRLCDVFSPQHITVIRNAQGDALSDIISEADNTAVADTIMQHLRRLTADDDSIIHASVAGGRKTMGVALALAMSLLGREQDELSHVLVSPPFESHPEFFYPPRQPRVLLTGTPPQQKPASTAQAEVSLAMIPFLRLRGLIDPALLAGAASWQELISRAQQTLQLPQLEINLTARHASIGGQPLRLSPVNLAFLLMLAQRRQRGEATHCPMDGAPDMALAQAFRQAANALGIALLPETLRALAQGMDKNFFERRKNAVNKAMREALGPGPAAACLIGRQRQPGEERFRHDLLLEPEHIIIREG